MRTIFTYMMTACLLVFTTAWCCCILPEAHAAASTSQTSSASASMASSTMVTSTDHGCCNGSASGMSGQEDNQGPADSQDGSCDCSVKVYEPGSRVELPPVAHAAAHWPALDLTLLAVDWLKPVSLFNQAHAAGDASWPPCPPAASSLVTQHCQLTI